MPAPRWSLRASSILLYVVPKFPLAPWYFRPVSSMNDAFLHATNQLDALPCKCSSNATNPLDEYGTRLICSQFQRDTDCQGSTYWEGCLAVLAISRLQMTETLV